jgi:hypothetical protein
MADGGYYQGNFIEGEMSGKGKRVWADGSYFEGDFSIGEKHGYGEMHYGLKMNTKDESYFGDWIDNRREGNGLLKMRDGTTLKGIFQNNQPEGHCEIKYADGSSYEGMVKRGVIHGVGEQLMSDGTAYVGHFNEGVRDGEGTFYMQKEQGGTYSLKGDFSKGEPTLTPNECHFELVSPVEKEEVDV